MLLDGAERVVYTTAAAAALLGIEAAALAGQPWPAFWAGVARVIGG